MEIQGEANSSGTLKKALRSHTVSIPYQNNIKITSKTFQNHILTITQTISTRRRMARERRGAESSVVSMETLYYKTIYIQDVLKADEKNSIKTIYHKHKTIVCIVNFVEFFTHRTFYKQTRLHTQSFTHMQTLLHTEYFPHGSFYTHRLLHTHTHAFTHRRFYTNTFTPCRDFYTQTLLHTHTPSHPETFTQRRFYTQTLLHTDAFTDTETFTQTHSHAETVTHRSFYTQTLLHTEAFTQRTFYTQTLLHTNTFFLHTDAFTLNKHFYAQRPGPRNRNFTSVFGDRTSFRAKGLRLDAYRNRNFISVFGDRTSFRAKRLRPDP